MKTHIECRTACIKIITRIRTNSRHSRSPQLSFTSPTLYPLKPSPSKPATAGFTLLELTTILVVVGILMAIMAPGWNALLRRLTLNHAQDVVYQAIRDAQGTARRLNVPYQASFRELNGTVQWAIHPAGANATTAHWKNLDPSIQIDGETTLQLTGGIRRVQFKENGNVNGQLGRLTLSIRGRGGPRRCVLVSTLIGAIRKGEEQPKPDSSGRTCY